MPKATAGRLIAMETKADGGARLHDLDPISGAITRSVDVAAAALQEHVRLQPGGLSTWIFPQGLTGGGGRVFVPIDAASTTDGPRGVAIGQRGDIAWHWLGTPGSQVKLLQRDGELGTGPFVHRYAVDGGVGGAEGAFTLCGFWLAEALAIQGRVEEAMHVFAAHAEASNHLGLLSEEIDPATRAQLGNFPQAFSHLGLVNAAWRIDLAMRLRDEGAPFGPRLVGPMFRRS